MTDYPILFSAPMVRAIIAGHKTQTRRVIQPSPPQDWRPRVGLFAPIDTHRQGKKYLGKAVYGASDESFGVGCPYRPGRRLWVRETHLFRLATADGIVYQSDFVSASEAAGFGAMYGGWTYAQFMPKRYARLWLEITAVRAEQIQEITETDAISEGCINAYGPDFHVGAFRTLWNLLHEKRGFGWDTNPWVWVITFRVMDGKP